MLRRKRAYEIDMLNGPVMPKLLAFALPLMVGNIFQMLYNIVFRCM